MFIFGLLRFYPYLGSFFVLNFNGTLYLNGGLLKMLRLFRFNDYRGFYIATGRGINSTSHRINNSNCNTRLTYLHGCFDLTLIVLYIRRVILGTFLFGRF